MLACGVQWRYRDASQSRLGPSPAGANLQPEERKYLQQLSRRIQARIQNSAGGGAEGPSNPAQAGAPDASAAVFSLAGQAVGQDVQQPPVRSEKALRPGGAGAAAHPDTVEELVAMRAELREKKATVALLQAQFDQLRVAFRAKQDIETHLVAKVRVRVGRVCVPFLFFWGVGFFGLFGY